MTLLQIQEISSSVDLDASRTVRIVNTTIGLRLDQQLQVSKLFLEEEELRWYLEDFAEKNPFEASRASTAVAMLNDYATHLISAIEWTAIITPAEFQGPLTIRVDGTPQAPIAHTAPKSTRAPILWELLERRELWPPSFRPLMVCVLRAIPLSKSAEGQRDIWSPISRPGRACNILVVAARPAVHNDVPHRLASRIIMDVAGKRGNLSVDIVRPGTFEALETCLALKEPGYYDLVHFDLHGVEGPSGSVFLVFLRKINEEKYFVFEPDYVSAGRVGTLLKQYGVENVILNSCRSARGSSPDTNIAQSFIHAGISAVIAMSHNVATRAVEILTANLYEALLFHHLPLGVAICTARRAMRLSPMRISKFGAPVEVHDSIVPVIYIDASAMEDAPGDVRYLAELSETNELYFEPRFPFGREQDILLLESALLIGNRPVLLVGQAAVGKTCLLDHLRQWWKQTGLIEDALHLRLSEGVGFPPNIYQRLERYFIGATSFSGPERIRNYLRNHRCLVIFDSLESVADPMSSEQRTELRRFLHDLRGGHTLVIISSRHKEIWLGGETITRKLKGLDIIPGLQQIDAIIADSQSIFDIPAWNGEEDRQYLEQLIKLVDGNPLAIHTCLMDFLFKGKSPKEYFFDLLAGAPIGVHRWEYGTNEGHRSLLELKTIIDDLEPKSLGDCVPLALAPFWTIIPLNDLFTFFKIHSFLTYRQFGASRKERMATFLGLMKLFVGSSYSTQEYQNLFAATTEDSLKGEEAETEEYNRFHLDSLSIALPDFEIPNVPPFTSILERAMKRIVDTLRKACFLQPMEKTAIPADLKPKGYMTVHPLVPIMLRAEPGYVINFLNVASTYRKALTLFYTWRTKNWPFQSMYYNPAWDRPRNELSMEFANFASAAEIALRRGHFDDSIQQLTVLRLLATLQRGVLKDPSRLRVVAVLLEKALDYVLSEIKRSDTKPRVPGDWFGLGGWFGPAAQDSNYSTDPALLRPFAMVFACQTALHDKHLDTGRQQHYVDLLRRLLHDTKQAGPPEQWPLNTYQRLLTSFEYFMKLLDTPETDLRTQVDQMWDLRDEFHRTLGFETYTGSLGFETHTGSHHSWLDIPVPLLAGSAAVAHLVTSAAQIRKAIDSKNYDIARQLIDKALLTEMNDASNDAMNIATLRKFLSEVDAEQWKWEDALGNYDEACKLEDQARVGPLSWVDLFKREFRRGKLVTCKKAADVTV